MTGPSVLKSRTGEPLYAKKFSQSFLARADEAAFWEAYVGALLKRNGLYVIQEPMDLGEFHDPEKSTCFDLHVSPNASLDPSFGVEVKSRRTYFSSVSDLAQKTKGGLTLCSQSWFLKNWPGYDCTGRDFLLVSAPTGCILWAPMGTQVTLGVEVTDYDRNEVYRVATIDPCGLLPLDAFVAMAKETGRAQHG